MTQSTFGITCLCLCGLLIAQSQVSFSRDSDQWKVSVQRSDAVINQLTLVSYENNGSVRDPAWLGLEQSKAFKRFYSLCMKDDGMYCDAPFGSCENETCGNHNEKCKPILTRRGSKPKYGDECAAFALERVLDRSNVGVKKK